MSEEPMQLKQADRKAEFKQGVDADAARRKREDTILSIRKTKKDDQLMKRRNVTEATQEPIMGSTAPQAITTAPRSDPSLQQKLQQLPQWKMMVLSDDPAAQLEGTTQFRKILSIERSPPIQQVIDQGVVPRLVQFLHDHMKPQLQFEAAWAITNIASGSPEQTRLIINERAVPILVELLQSVNDDVREQAVWALGNIAGDSPLCRDYVLSNLAMNPLLNILSESKKITMIRNATWTLSNFCRGKPQPPFDMVKSCLPILARLVTSMDDEVLTDSCWALSYLSDGPNDRIQAVIDCQVVPRMVSLLMHPNPSVQTPALRTVGNIVTGDDTQTDTVLQLHTLRYLLTLLASNKKSIKKEACWTISNITAGNAQQIQQVIDSSIIPPLIYILKTAEFEIKKEAAWAISNATSGGTPQQIKYLCDEGCIPPLCDLLTVNDSRIITVALEGLENILKIGVAMAGYQDNPYALQVEECSGMDKIDKLQYHNNEAISKKATEIIGTFFGDNGAVDMPQQQVQGQSFGFGVPQAPPQFNFSGAMQ